MNLSRVCKSKLSWGMVGVTLALAAWVSGPVDAQVSSGQGNIHNDGGQYVGRIVIIIDSTPTNVIFCGDALSKRSCVIIDPGAGGEPPIKTEIALQFALNAQPGDRYDITAQTVCDGRLYLTLEKKLDGQSSSVRGNIPDDGQNYVGRIIAVTDRGAAGAVHCGASYNDRSCVIVNPGGGPPVRTVCGIDPTITVSAGDRFEITAQVVCSGRIDLTLDPL